MKGLKRFISLARLHYHWNGVVFFFLSSSFGLGTGRKAIEQRKSWFLCRDCGKTSGKVFRHQGWHRQAVTSFRGNWGRRGVPQWAPKLRGVRRDTRLLHRRNGTCRAGKTQFRHAYLRKYKKSCYRCSWVFLRFILPQCSYIIYHGPTVDHKLLSTVLIVAEIPIETRALPADQSRSDVRWILRAAASSGR